MNILLRWLVLALLLCAAGLQAQTPEDEYLRVYYLIQQADDLATIGNTRDAAERYQEAYKYLSRFPTVFPGWQEKVVAFRLRYLQSKIGTAPAAPSTNAAPAEATPAGTPPPVMVEAPTPAAPASSPMLQQMQEELQRLRAQNIELQEKLKEAIRAHSNNAGEQLARVEQQARELMKENDLLKVTLGQEQQKTATWVEPAVVTELRAALAESNARLEKQAQTVATLQSENDVLRKKVDGTGETANAAQRRLSDDLQKARTELAELQSQNASLRTERASLASRLEDAAKGSAKDYEARITKLEQRNRELEKERQDFERAEAKKRKNLEDEIADLRARLTKAEQQASRRGGRTDDAQKEINALQARIAALEAKPVPFTAEELAAMRKPAVQLAATTPGAGTPTATTPAATPPETTSTPVARERPSRRQLPTGTGPMALAAERAFREGRFAEAEQKYQEILQQDATNVFVLGNLAAAQIQLRKMDEAEKSIARALVAEPEDPFNLYLMSRVRFEKGRTDDALTMISLAAKSSPDNPEIQNYLGIVLGEKGQRTQAESAFRKAIQLRPNYPEAHNNLAVIYAAQTPPATALARWHYEKALAGGHPKNPELEKLFKE